MAFSSLCEHFETSKSPKTKKILPKDTRAHNVQPSHVQVCAAHMHVDLS